MLVETKKSSLVLSLYIKMGFHLSRTCAQKLFPPFNILNMVLNFINGIGVFLFACFSSSSSSQKSDEVYMRFSQEHCIAPQNSLTDCIPSPPNYLGVKIMDFDMAFLDLFMNFTRMFSNSVMKSFGGFGNIAAM